LSTSQDASKKLRHASAPPRRKRDLGSRWMVATTGIFFPSCAVVGLLPPRANAKSHGVNSSTNHPSGTRFSFSVGEFFQNDIHMLHAPHCRVFYIHMLQHN